MGEVFLAEGQVCTATAIGKSCPLVVSCTIPFTLATPSLLVLTFPSQSETILTNARKDAQLINPETGDYLELDLYIPSLSLAFEYQVLCEYIRLLLKFLSLQDLSHFKNVYSAAEQIQARDKLKQKLAAAKGIQLITIPFWWDGKVER